MSNIACLHNVLWSFKKRGQCNGKQTVAFTLTSTPFVDKVLPQGVTPKQACCNYCKAFSCSYIFIFYLGVLGNEHMEGGQSRWQPEECVSIAVVNWSGPENRAHCSWHLYPASGSWDHGSWNDGSFQGLFRKDLRTSVFVNLSHRLVTGSHLGDVLLSGSLMLSASTLSTKRV